MKNLHLVALVALACSTVVGNALADTAVVDFNGSGAWSGEALSVWADSRQDVATGFLSTVAGPYNFSITDTDGALTGTSGTVLNPRYMFCIELEQFADNAALTYDVRTDIENVPVPGVDVGVSPMESAKAELVRRLYGEHGVAVTTYQSPTDRTAFQLALWEIIHETSGTLNVDEGAGSFYVKNNTVDSGARSTANNMLASLASADKKATGLTALVHNTKQDFMYWTGGTEPTAAPVPEPVMLVQLLGLGLGIAFVGLRRRQRG